MNRPPVAGRPDCPQVAPHVGQPAVVRLYKGRDVMITLGIAPKDSWALGNLSKVGLEGDIKSE